MNNDIATLILSSQQIFEHWNDKVATTMKYNCIESIQRDWKGYINDTNTRINIFMKAEFQIDQAISDYKHKIDDL
jgi:hypothetical protein